MTKRFVLDTNIILQDPKCMIEGFDDNEVIICGTVLQELDKKKGSSNGIVGYNARECCRILDELRSNGNLIEGVPVGNSGGRLLVEPDGVKQEYLPEGYYIQSPDNRIISTCIHLNRNVPPEQQVILVTNDISMRVNATACGIKVESYRNDQVTNSGYTGHRIIHTFNGVIDEINKNKYIDLSLATDEDDLLPNEFVTLKSDGNQSSLSVYRDGKLNLLNVPDKVFGGVKPMNAMQSYALYALKAPVEQIPLVILKGPAGTAKTFLSLAAGLDDTYSQRHDGRYYRMLLSRPNAEANDPGFGFLPGDLQEKMTPLLAPYFDNLEALFINGGSEFRSGGKDSDKDYNFVQRQIDDLFESGTLQVCALNFIRGRTLQNSYIICDEAQNANRSLIRDVITRAGKGTKVVVCGDLEQIDAPNLDKNNNGLVYAIEHMKASNYSAIIQFEGNNNVRSRLSKDAIERMR